MPSSPFTDPDPFISSANNPVSYYGIHIEEIEREVNKQCSALGTTKPTWYRYDSATGRTSYDPSADSSGESLIGYDYAYKPYITDIRDAYESSIFSAWDITTQEYLEAKYATADWPSAGGYPDWVHSADALSEDGDCYDRDLDELRSYEDTVSLTKGGETTDTDLDGDADLGWHVPPGFEPVRSLAGDSYTNYCWRAIIHFSVSNYPANFITVFLNLRATYYTVEPHYPGRNPFPHLGNCNIGHFNAASAYPLIEYHEETGTLISSHNSLPIISNVTNVINADINGGKTYSSFNLYFDTMSDEDGEGEALLCEPVLIFLVA